MSTGSESQGTEAGEPILSTGDGSGVRERAWAGLKEAGLFVPNLVKLAARLLRDRRVPLSRKVALAALAGYLVMPLDLIPDFIPVLGAADDLILVSFTLWWVLRAVPAEVVEAHWDGKVDLLSLLDQVRQSVRTLWNRKRPA